MKSDYEYVVRCMGTTRRGERCTRHATHDNGKQALCTPHYQEALLRARVERAAKEAMKCATPR